MKSSNSGLQFIGNLIIVQIKQIYSIFTTRCNYVSKTTQLAYHVKAIHTRW